MFRALLCPSSGARQTAVAASGFGVSVEVEVVGLLVRRQCLPTNKPTTAHYANHQEPVRLPLQPLVSV